jgi:CheY-like chemotaxis protein
MKVLVIDTPDSANTLGELLELEGYEVALAYSQTEGLKALIEIRPEVIICEVGLYLSDWVNVCRLFKDSLPTRPTFIAHTGYVFKEQETKEAGFDGYLLKPAGFDELLSLLAITRPPH